MQEEKAPENKQPTLQERKETKADKFAVRKQAKKARRKERVDSKRKGLRVLISNIKPEATKEDMLAFFPELKVCDVLFLEKRGDKSAHIGKCYVGFENEKHLDLALLMNGKKLLGQAVTVEKHIKVYPTYPEPTPIVPVKRSLGDAKETATKKKKLESSVEKVKPKKEKAKDEKSVEKTDKSVKKDKKEKSEKSEEKANGDSKKEKKTEKKDRKSDDSKKETKKQEKTEKKPVLSPEEKAALTVYVGNISRYVHAAQLRDFFKHCGTITSCNFPRSSEAVSLGWASIEFADKLARTKALLLNGKTLKNREIQVSEFTLKGNKSKE
jgi:RNA recognition motif-containing protein